LQGAGAGRDAAQVDGLRAGILVTRRGVEDGVERGGDVERGDGDRAEGGARVVARRAVVDGERDGAVQDRWAVAGVHIPDRAQGRLVERRGGDAGEAQDAGGRVIAAGDASLVDERQDVLDAGEVVDD